MRTHFLSVAGVIALAFALPARVSATVDDALSFALEAAHPYVKQGFMVREDYYGGDLGVKEQKALQYQLFKGNEYWFFLATDNEKAVLDIHVYDSDGNLLETKNTRKGKFWYANVLPKTTGSYYVIVNVEDSPAERTGWALVYGFR